MRKNYSLKAAKKRISKFSLRRHRITLRTRAHHKIVRRKVDTHVRPGRYGVYIGPRGGDGKPSEPDPDDD